MVKQPDSGRENAFETVRDDGSMYSVSATGVARLFFNSRDRVAITTAFLVIPSTVRAKLVHPLDEATTITSDTHI